MKKKTYTYQSINKICTIGKNNLYLGDIFATRDLKLLKTKNITCIISAAIDVKHKPSNINKYSFELHDNKN